MSLIWQKFKIGLLVGMLYAVYFAIKGTKALKQIEVPTANRIAKS